MQSGHPKTHRVITAKNLLHCHAVVLSQHACRCDHNNEHRCKTCIVQLYDFAMNYHTGSLAISFPSYLVTQPPLVGIQVRVQFVIACQRIVVIKWKAGEM